MHNNRIEFARVARPTRKSEALLLAAHSRRYALRGLKAVRQIILFALLGLVLESVHGEPSAEPASISLETYCSANSCRRHVRFHLRTDGDPIEETVPLYWPAVQNNKISLLPGEKLYVEATVEGQALTSLKQVESIDDPKKTLIFEFTQGDKDLGMMLAVKNPFQRLLKVHINMIDFSHKPHQTSSCPVVPGGSGFESWPHPIPELVISDLRFLEDGSEIACVY
jgi:hypothetical protein